MTMGITIRAKARFRCGRKGARRPATSAQTPPVEAQCRIPRVARLLALAYRFEKLIADGEVRDYAELGRLGHVTRARVTQIMNLLNLAPDIQEQVLFAAPVSQGKDLLTERQLRHVVAEIDWKRQRRRWSDCAD